MKDEFDYSKHTQFTMHPQSHAQEKFFMKSDTSNNADLVRVLQ